MKTPSRIFFQIIVALIAVLPPFSCTREYVPVPAPVQDGEMVPVSFDLSSALQVEMTPSATKAAAINTSSNVEINDIKNLWILQFNGTADTSRRILNIYDTLYTPSVLHKLIASSRTNRLVFVANTFAKNTAFGSCNTYADAKKIMQSISKEADVVRTDTVGGVVRHYPVMNGHVDTTVTSGLSVSDSLRFSVARIDVEIVNNISSSLTIESITLKNVPDRYYYITDYSLPTLYPDASSFSTLDYEPTLWTAGEQNGSTNRRKFTFYMPANKRDTTAQDTYSGLFKGMYAPDKATYAFITASYLEGTAPDTVRRSVTYTFYLGEDLENDYNIVPNGHYTYTFTINSKGDEDTDGRVDDTGVVDFCSKDLANCYMINPPVASGSWRNYRIPVRRVWEFWKSDGKYEDQEAYALTSSTYGWVVDVIWSEFPIDSTHFVWVTKNRVRSQGLNPQSDYFEFRIREGVKGNCVVGIRRYDENLTPDNIYLWSWHLWVTDYKPDMAFNYTISPADSIFSYKVRGGDVHRHDNDIFNKGTYKNKVMMDRNLGAPDIYYHGLTNGTLYYQFGRKDPFSGPRKIYIRQNDGSFNYETWSTSTYTIENTAAGSNCNNMPYSIRNPLVFIKGSYWTYNDKYNPTTFDKKIRWQDPEATTASQKSIFDPCPPGWKVPNDSTWYGFNAQVSSQYSKFLWNDPLSTGRNYFPKGTDDRTTGTIFYPASGYLRSGSGSSDLVGSNGLYWSCSPYNVTNGYYLNFNSGGVFPSYSGNRAYGFPVRCVQE